MDININRAEEVLRLLSSNDVVARRHASQMLKEMQQTVKARQKRIRLYISTVQALEHQYAQWQVAARQQLAQLDIDIADLNHQIVRIKQQRSNKEQELAGIEQHLQSVRDYAQQRHDKKTKRERQYNQYYNIPIINKQYQKKYVRAHDKNARAEQELVQIREAMDECQEAARQSASLAVRKQQEYDAKIEQRDAVQQQIAEADKCLAYLRQGQQFWTHFDQYQADLLTEASNRLIEISKSTNGSNDLFSKRRRSSTQLQPQDQQQRDWTVTFRSVCYEYGEKEKYGSEKWDQVEVEFECARCRQSLVGWPTPDKVRQLDLLCVPCYQETRTSMIMEKKMNALSGKFGIERPVSLDSSRRTSSSSSSNLLVLSAADRFSSSSSSTSPSSKRPSLSSSSSFVNDAKKLFRGIRFSSASSFPKSSAQQQQAEQLSHRPLPPAPPFVH